MVWENIPNDFVYQGGCNEISDCPPIFYLPSITKTDPPLGRISKVRMYTDLTYPKNTVTHTMFSRKYGGYHYKSTQPCISYGFAHVTKIVRFN